MSPMFVEFVADILLIYDFVKSLFYAGKPATIELLAGAVRPEIFEKVMEKWGDRMIFVKYSRG